MATKTHKFSYNEFQAKLGIKPGTILRLVVSDSKKEVLLTVYHPDK